MNIEITGRHLDVTPALKEFAEEKLSKLKRLLDEPLDVHIVLGIEKHRHMAEIQVKARSGTFTGAQETGDLYASIGEVVDKLERQALKHKERLHDHKHRKGPRDPESAAAIEASVASVEAGEISGPTTATGAPEIFRTEGGYRLKPMSAEDAALELEATRDAFLVFRDSRTDRIAVLHRVAAGQYGLIEPV